jgi:hypothetical protein
MGVQTCGTMPALDVQSGDTHTVASTTGLAMDVLSAMLLLEVETKRVAGHRTLWMLICAMLHIM